MILLGHPRESSETLTSAGEGEGSAAFLLFGALVKLTADYLLTSNLGDYLWRLLWVLATAFWTFRLLHLTNQLPEQDSSATLLARRASLTLMTMTFVGAAVSGR